MEIFGMEHRSRHILLRIVKTEFESESTLEEIQCELEKKGLVEMSRVTTQFDADLTVTSDLRVAVKPCNLLPLMDILDVNQKIYNCSKYQVEIIL